MSKVDYLTEDSIVPSGQAFCCVSFLTDKENKTTLSGIKFRGGFASYDEACEHAKKLQTIDPYFNVFVGETGKWLPFDPNPDSEAVKDSEYANEQLNNLMKGYVENQEKAKIVHEQRKNELVRQNILDNLKTKKENLMDVEKKMGKHKKKAKDSSSLEQSKAAIEEQIKNMEEKTKELDKQLEELNSKLSEFPSKMEYPKAPAEMQ
jgi:DNA repair exonuclease SbcCD ATPase subunit